MAESLSSQAMIAGLIDGKPPSELVTYAQGRLKKKTPEFLEALDEPPGERHRRLLTAIQEHIRYLESHIQAFDEYLFSQLAPTRPCPSGFRFRQVLSHHQNILVCSIFQGLFTANGLG